MKESRRLTVFIKTFGCQMNARDSEVICGLVKNAGYAIAEASEDADIVLFNTCSVRQHAEDRVWSEIGRMAKRWTRGDGGGAKKQIIGLVGCMAQNYGQDAFHRAPEIDFVVGPSDISKIPGIIAKFIHSSHSIVHPGLHEFKIWETDGKLRPEEIYHTGFSRDKEHVYVVISEGCSNYCSYCVVPYVRGSLRHRQKEDILKEIQEVLDKGIDKVTLLGQNVNAYQGPGNFVALLKLVNNLAGLKEFSFITSHPKDTSLDLFKAMADLEKLKKYLHLPLQSGSDKILKLMNRGYTRKFYLDIIDSYRKIVDGGALTTDIIVGYPTESEADFQDTYDLLKEAEFNAAYIFKYSPRPHTEAQKLIDDVSKEEKEKRHGFILGLQKAISRKQKVGLYNDNIK